MKFGFEKLVHTIRVGLFFLALLSPLFLKIFSGNVFATAPGNFRWVAHNAGIAASNINGLAVDPTDGNTVYVLTAGAGVYKTTDGGASWNAANGGLPTDKTVSAAHLYGNMLTIDPNNHLTLYTQFLGRIYKTTDGASSWAESDNGISFSCGLMQIIGVVVDPTDSTHLFASSVASSCTGGTWESHDSGANWIQINGPPTASGYNDAWPMNIDPSDNSKFYVATVHEEDLRSIDGGHTLSPMTFPAGYASADGNVVTVHPTSHVLFIGNGNGLVKSNDFGVTVTEVPEFAGHAVMGLQFARSNVAIGYAVTYDGLIFQTINSGGSWNLMSTNSAITFANVAISPTDPTKIYLSTRGKGVYVSTNSGSSVSAINNDNLPASFVMRTWAQSLSSPNVVYIAINNVGIYRSTDGGYTWTYRSKPDDYINLFVDPTDPNTLLINGYTTDSHIRRSTDGGLTWSTSNALLSGTLPLYGLAFAPSNHNVVYAKSHFSTDGFLKSMDNGQTWTVSHFFDGKDFINTGLVVDPTDANVVFNAVANDFPYKTTDGGTTWTKLTNGITDPSGISFSVSPFDHNVVFFGSSDQVKYFKSTDGGATFSFSLDAGSHGDGLTTPVTFDKSDPNTIYAGGNGYIMGFKSSDGGNTWNNLPSTGLTGSVDYLQRASFKNKGEILAGDGVASFVIYENYIPKFDQSSFSVANTNGTTQFHPGDKLQFNFNLNNFGPATGTNSLVKIVLPNGVTYSPGSTKIDGAIVIPDPVSGKTLNVKVATIPYGVTVPITFNATIDASASGSVTVDPTVTSNEDVSGTHIADVVLNVTTVTPAPPTDPNCPVGWLYCIQAGPHFVGKVTYITDPNAPGVSLLIPKTAYHLDMAVKIKFVTSADLGAVKQAIPLPSTQGFLVVGPYVKAQILAAINGAAITTLDNPAILIVPFDLSKLKRYSTARVQIAWYDKASKTWKLLSAKTTVDSGKHTVTSSSKMFPYFVAVVK